MPHRRIPRIIDDDESIVKRPRSVRRPRRIPKIIDDEGDPDKLSIQANLRELKRAKGLTPTQALAYKYVKSEEFRLSNDKTAAPNLFSPFEIITILFNIAPSFPGAFICMVRPMGQFTHTVEGQRWSRRIHNKSQVVLRIDNAKMESDGSVTTPTENFKQQMTDFMNNPSKNVFVLYTIVQDDDKGHAMVIYHEKGSGVIEVFDPNGKLDHRFTRSEIISGWRRMTLEGLQRAHSFKRHSGYGVFHLAMINGVRSIAERLPNPTILFQQIYGQTYGWCGLASLAYMYRRLKGIDRVKSVEMLNNLDLLRTLAFIRANKLAALEGSLASRRRLALRRRTTRSLPRRSLATRRYRPYYKARYMRI